MIITKGKKKDHILLLSFLSYLYPPHKGKSFVSYRLPYQGTSTGKMEIILLLLSAATICNMSETSQLDKNSVKGLLNSSLRLSKANLQPNHIKHRVPHLPSSHELLFMGLVSKTSTIWIFLCSGEGQSGDSTQE